jgi:hypothetical protein
MPVLLRRKPVAKVDVSTVTERAEWEDLFSRVAHPFMV